MNTPKNLLIANPDQSIVLTPAEVIRRMFAYTDENGILIVPQWPCDDCVEQGYYICRMPLPEMRITALKMYPWTTRRHSGNGTGAGALFFAREKAVPPMELSCPT